MIYVLITLIAVAIVLFILSFFMNDKFADLQNQFEQFSLATIQDTYQIKKKLKVLEEELIIDQIPEAMPQTTDHNKPLLVQKVYRLYQKGYSIEDIASRTQLSKNDVQSIIKSY